MKLNEMKRSLSYLLILFAIGFSAMVKGQKYSCEKWEVIDIPFSINVRGINPFDIDFGAVITHENGKSMKVPGFYNGNKIWVVRFCPPMEGKWAFTTYSTISSGASKNGTIQVRESTKTGEHGPIVISKKNQQKFSYADGTPYFLMAFELDWLFALDCENPNGIPKTENIVKHLVENKFNHVVMNVYAYNAGWGERDKIKPEHNFAEPEVFPFGGNNDNPDFSTLNINFFKHLDRVIAHLDDMEIISHLMIYVWNKKVNWPEAGSESDNMYFDYVVKRYQAFPNLVWDISKEALDYGHNDMSYITERIERLRVLDAHKRLLSVHDYAYCSAFPGKVDFISIQDWKPNIYNTMLDVSNKYHSQPVFNIEHGGYEKTMHSIFDGAYNDPITCLERNYECVFAGSYSTYYWQNTSWHEVIYNPETLPEENKPAFEYYKNMVKLFEDYEFNSLQPFQSIHTTYCLTDHKKYFLFLLTPNMLSLNGHVKELEGHKFKVKEYDPLTGVYWDSGIQDFTNRTWTGFKRNENVKSPFSIMILEIIN